MPLYPEYAEAADTLTRTLDAEEADLYAGNGEADAHLKNIASLKSSAEENEANIRNEPWYLAGGQVYAAEPLAKFDSIITRASKCLTDNGYYQRDTGNFGDTYAAELEREERGALGLSGGPAEPDPSLEAGSPAKPGVPWGKIMGAVAVFLVLTFALKG